MGEFATMIQELQQSFGQAANSAYQKLDKATYRLLVDGLKGSDPEAVKACIDQLAYEGKGAAVPPLFLVSKAHPNEWVRNQSIKALAQIADNEELSSLTAGKGLKEQISALVEHYGNYRN